MEPWFPISVPDEPGPGAPRQIDDDEIAATVGATNTDPKPLNWTKSADDILASIQRLCLRTRTAGA